MTQRVLLSAEPAALRPLLTQALGVHPVLRPRMGVDASALHAGLEAATRARVGGLHVPWVPSPPWVRSLALSGVHARLQEREGVLVVRADAADVAALAAELPGTVALRALGDGRLGVPADADVPTALACADAWLRALDAARDAPTPTLRAGGPVDGAALLDALGLPAHAGAAAALGLLAGVPSGGGLRIPRVLDGAFRARDRVEAALAPWSPGPRPPAPDHAAVHIALARDAETDDEAVARAQRALGAPGAQACRAEAAAVLIARGAPEAGVAVLEAWLRTEDAPEAWSGLLALGDHPAARPLLARARHHPHPAVRGALARWLVAQGLEEQAAESLCRVQGTDWFSPPAPG
jgi:hypothetical protein